MNAAEYARRYAEAQVTMVDRGRLLLLVLEGGLRFLRLTREALAARDLAGMTAHLGRAQAIIAELRGTLDYDAGGTIARDLARLYDFMLVHLAEANSRRSLRHVDEVLAVLGTITDAYHTILEGRRGTEPDAASAA
jgi:flagellar protein FliS